MHPTNHETDRLFYIGTMCEVVSDELTGQIEEMRSVLSTMMRLHFEGEKDKLQQFYKTHRTTVRQIDYFLKKSEKKTGEHAEQDNIHKPVKDLFMQITSALTV